MQLNCVDKSNAYYDIWVEKENDLILHYHIPKGVNVDEIIDLLREDHFPYRDANTD
jgi:hypothetical protein